MIQLGFQNYKASIFASLFLYTAWKTQARAGPFIYDRWLKVDLGKKSTLTGVQTQGGSSVDANGDLGKFEILYSLDDTLYIAATPANNIVVCHSSCDDRLLLLFLLFLLDQRW